MVSVNECHRNTASVGDHNGDVHSKRMDPFRINGEHMDDEVSRAI